MPHGLSVDIGHIGERCGIKLYKGDVDHHSCREPSREGEHAGMGALAEEGNGTSYSGGETCKEGEPKGYKYCVVHRLLTIDHRFK